MGSLDGGLEGVTFPLVQISTERARVDNVTGGVHSTQDALKLSWRETERER